jgi:hypothetical protein
MHSSVAGRACAKAAALLLPAGRAFARANLRAARVAEDSEGSSLVGQKHCTGIHLGELPRIGGCGARLIMARLPMMHALLDPWPCANTAAPLQRV